MNLLEEILNKRSKIDTPLWNEIHTFLNEDGLPDDGMSLSLRLLKVIQCAKLPKLDRLDESSLMIKSLIRTWEMLILKCELIISDPFFYSTFDCNVEKAKRLRDTFINELQLIKKSRGSTIKTLTGSLEPVMIKLRIAGKNQKERVEIIYKLFKKFDILHNLEITGDDIEFTAKERIRKWDSKIMSEPNKLIRKYRNVETSGK